MTRDSDTHPEGGDALAAPFMGSAGRQASPETCAYLTLAERVEKACGPDRELDGLIYCAMDPYCVDRRRAMDRVGVFGPAYTASLDAAMTLVDWSELPPNDWMFAIERNNSSGKWCARADQLGGECGNGFSIIGDDCATPELAVTNFALRALAAQGGVS